MWKAAEELVRCGLKPTVVAVRDRLGRGSFTTINNFLAEWRQETPEAETRPVGVEEALAVLGVDAGTASEAGRHDALPLLIEGLRSDLLQSRAQIEEALNRLEALERLVRRA